MDCFLVFISLIDVIVTLSARSSPKIFGILRVFRLLRTLRPLRMISRAPGLKLVVQTLLSSLRPIGNIVLICCTFFIIFGILGVQVTTFILYVLRHLNFCLFRFSVYIYILMSFIFHLNRLFKCAVWMPHELKPSILTEFRNVLQIKYYTVPYE